ncbi:MAG TPA: ATP-binding cassette domain-containing protein [Candidatus Dormibacteraeota bacterium]|nr:ATP-binding cassette domain-containing protein [Candidatus Dormibacteraeota bacterium]
MATAHLERLTYWYPGSAAPALDDVRLTLGDGVTLVAGPSGGGKSTLLRVLNGLVPHFHGGRIKGSAEVAGHDIVATPTRVLARTVGFVFQDPELQAVYDTVEREVAFGLENVGTPTHAMHARVDEALAQAGADHLADRRIRTLSGGERQRVALASVLAMQPRLVVLDEPTSQLDPEGASLVLTAVSRLAEAGRAVVISEHRLERLRQVADQLVVVDGGRVAVHQPDAWQPPGIAPLAARSSTPGVVAWSLRGVTAGFAGRAVLEGIDLAGRRGEVVALSGPNGGGKTTLLRTIAGSLAPLAGEVERRPGRIAYLPQNPTALLHRPTVRSEVLLTLERSGELESPEQVLGALGLAAVAGRYPRDLSSGERQRAALAAVLPGHPDLVLLDEPTRGMDPAARAALMTLVAALRDAGSAVVLATHDADLRDALADRVATVGGGRVSDPSSVRA